MKWKVEHLPPSGRSGQMGKGRRKLDEFRCRERRVLDVRHFARFVDLLLSLDQDRIVVVVFFARKQQSSWSHAVPKKFHCHFSGRS